MRWLFPITVVIVAVVAMCTVPILNTQEGNPVQLGDDSMSNDGPTADVIESSLKVGETYTLRLDSNPTTGYDWYIKSNDGLDVNKEYVQRVTDPMVCGAGGTAVFDITSEKAGEYTLVMNYERSFEKDSCVRTVTVKLTFT